ncbi:occlusion-derived virus envelope protein 66a [Orgyia leucostigma nucleopolyhedrovirus]|uniref:Occlusion-derived virus envelope protein 66a n=1 Tax=Orgyia leucostigma nucleopolyhedrovirus TaxID=490711 RepID=B0FDR9_9ABAC|nr:occlusion-derived virus envelope protein 66a [Orgyia leucostigma nucleopolyhedrovirus]ABY65777.1 occlusion-derived virus envelope protein 66a [Orgyia leucostigma nucleopolyhedrovirus]
MSMVIIGVAVTLVAIVIVLVVLIFTQSNPTTPPTLPVDPDVNELPESVSNTELARFETYYLNTLTRKILQETVRIETPTRWFSDDDNIFMNITPYENANDFKILLHTLMGYAVRLIDVNDSLYNDASLRTNLLMTLNVLDRKLPVPAPEFLVPYNFEAEHWYEFAVTLPECLMRLNITLQAHTVTDSIVAKLIHAYLPEPNNSLGWRRSIKFATRMCLPFVYRQMLTGQSLAAIGNQRAVATILSQLHYNLVNVGDGIHQDYVNFVDGAVRNYSYLIDNYFTFDYYNALYDGLVNVNNVDASLQIVGSDQGVIFPALIYKSGLNHVPVLPRLVTFQNGVFAADFSKMVTVRNELYFASQLGPATDVAYYQSNRKYRQHALLWSMTKKIWPNEALLITHRTNTIGLDSGILLLHNNNGLVDLPSEENDFLAQDSTLSYFPRPGYCAVSSLEPTSAAIMSHARYEELDIECYSYTLYHARGLVQLYDRVRCLSASATGETACVILTRDPTQPTGDAAWPTTDLNTHSYNRVTAKHHNVINYKTLPDFSQMYVPSVNMSYSRQTIAASDVNAGTGTCCFSLSVQSVAANDATIVTKLEDNRMTFLMATSGNDLECLFEFPFVILKDNKNRRVSINNARHTDRTVHTIHFDDINRLLSHLSLTVSNLTSDTVQRTEFAFILRDSTGNQMHFNF